MVIIGTGIGGISVLNEMRKTDLETPIVVVDANEGYTYLKPMLSKMCQSGFDEKILNIVATKEIEATYNCTLLSNVRAKHINTEKNTVTLSNKKIIHFSNLIIASGSVPRRTSYNTDEENINVKNVSSWKDYVILMDELTPSKRISIVGAGIVGCEVAYDLSHRFDHINLINSANGVLSNLNDVTLSQEVLERLSARNVQLFNSVKNISYRCNPFQSVHFEKGDEKVELDSEIIIECVGHDSSTDLLDGKYMSVIPIDDKCKTEFDNIYALGDCASYKGRVFSNIIIIKKCAKIIANNISNIPSSFNQEDYNVIVKVGKPILKTTINVK
ncbi:NAD(P)/FAD-dependent oxidoreductase [Vibrio ordalii]|uniref:NAD(P)/FAD-dependent oxidoreductase n=1 Tax=Vibrio ordalii TaxID=28174 RepID=UPI00084C73AF|nr:FAD-dependent oxidoreductase [Vibrio ordalii]